MAPMIIARVLDLALPLASVLPQTAGPYITLMLAGFAIGILGHLTQERWLVVAGIILIFLGVFFFPLAVNLTSNDRPPPVDTTPELGQ
jgi:cytochrome c biogenesis protein CcdA